MPHVVACSPPLLAALAIGWGVLVAGSLVMVARADQVAAKGSAAATWPSTSKLVRSASKPTLLVFVHPQCPCSVATIAELERLAARTSGALEVMVVAYTPEASWERASLLGRASAIPGVRVVSDPAGAEARLFDATTSGQTLLFTPTGRVLFRGGITRARGHEGDNDGSRTIEALVTTNAPAGLLHSSVFGCAIASPEKGQP